MRTPILRLAARSGHANPAKTCGRPAAGRLYEGPPSRRHDPQIAIAHLIPRCACTLHEHSRPDGGGQDATRVPQPVFW